MKTKLKIKKYVDNPHLSWEERYRLLEQHHKQETEELILIIEWLENDIERKEQ